MKNLKEKCLAKKNGITLIALVITIIILLILATITIVELRNTSLFGKTAYAKNKYKQAERTENNTLDDYTNKISEYGGKILKNKEQEDIPIQGTISDLKGGSIEVSAKVDLEGNINFNKTKYVFTASNEELGTYDESKYNDGLITESSSVISHGKKAGTYYLHVLVTSSSGNKKEIISDTTATSKGIENFSPSSNLYELNFPRGNYKFECWGSKGSHGNEDGSVGSKYGANGAYTSGNLQVEETKTLYIGVSYMSFVSISKNNDLQTNKIMIAAGGGNADWSTGECAPAGGLIGYSTSDGRTGGTQTERGTPISNPNGNDVLYPNWMGYRPGGMQYYSVGFGGASSYISGHTGCVAMTSETDTSPKKINGIAGTTGTTNVEYSKHYSNLYFTNTQMIDGKGYNWTNVIGSYIGMTLPNGTKSAGNSGTAYARVTSLDK